MKTFYHNITKNLLNETDESEFLDYYEDGDVVYTTVSGVAILELLTSEEITNLKNWNIEIEED